MRATAPVATICTCLLGVLPVACGGGSSSAPSNQPGPGGASGARAWHGTSSRRMPTNSAGTHTCSTWTGGRSAARRGLRRTLAARHTSGGLSPLRARHERRPAHAGNGHPGHRERRRARERQVGARHLTVGPTGFASGSAGARAAIPGAGAGSPSGDTSSGAGQATGESEFIVEIVVTGLDRPSGLARLPGRPAARRGARRPHPDRRGRRPPRSARCRTG